MRVKGIVAYVLISLFSVDNKLQGKILDRLEAAVLRNEAL